MKDLTDESHIFDAKGQCYFLPRGLRVSEVLVQIKEQCPHGAVYPEHGMTMSELMTALPYVDTIITESPYLVALYDCSKVWTWKDGRWRQPNEQTYGASIEALTKKLFDNRISIPLAVVSDEEVQKLRERQIERYGASLIRDHK